MSMMSKGIADAPMISMLAESDIEQGRRFWRDTLGFEEIGYEPVGQEAYYRAGQGSGFGIYQHQGGSKCDHTQIGFMVEDLDGTVQSLRQKGITFEEYDLPNVKTVNGIATMPGGGRGAWFRDPGGNIVAVFTTDPQLLEMMRSGKTMAGAGTGMGGRGAMGTER